MCNDRNMKTNLSLRAKMLISAFAVIGACFLIMKVLESQQPSSTDVQAFLDGRSDTLSGYMVGPIMQGIK